MCITRENLVLLQLPFIVWWRPDSHLWHEEGLQGLGSGCQCSRAPHGQGCQILEVKTLNFNYLIIKAETSRFLPSSRSQSQPLYNWEKTFYTEDKTEVERTLQGLGYNVEWRRGDILHYWYVMTSIRRHPTTGEMVWCNQVSFYNLTSLKICVIQSSVSHGSYYTHLPDAENLGYTDQVTFS